MTNRIQDAFDNIKADSQLKESTKQFLHKRYEKKMDSSHRMAIRYVFSFVCAVLVLITGTAGYSWIQTPVSYVSIDVNPSIELSLNRFDRVVSVKAYNVEGEEIIEGLSLNGKKYTDAIQIVVESDRMSVYLTGKPELVLTVAADEERKNELETGVKHCVGYMGKGCHNALADIETVPQAHECGLSFGKYNAWLKLSQYDNTITASDCKHMSMAQIQGLIREYENDISNNDRRDSKPDDENTVYDTENDNCDNMNDASSHHKQHRHRGL